MSNNRESSNPHSPTMANDKGVEILQIVIDWYRGNRNSFTSAQATTIGTEIANVLNNTTKV